MSVRLLNLIYYVLVVGLGATSAYLSYFGFLRNFQGLAWVFAIMIGIWLVGSNLVIQRARLAGRGVLRGIVLLLTGAFFSFISNFNYLYTNAMQRDVAVETVATAHETFKFNLIEARGALEGMDILDRERQERAKLDLELRQLCAQVGDPGNPGVGSKAREHMNNVNRLLGGGLTELAIPRSGLQPSAYEEWCSNYSQNAVAHFERSVADQTSTSVEQLVRNINDLLAKYSNPPSGLAAENLGTLREYASQSLNVELRANELLPDTDVSLKEINFMDGRLGEIEFSLRNGFIERPNMGATIISGLLAALVDLAPLVFALLAFQHTQPSTFHEPSQRPRTRRTLT